MAVQESLGFLAEDQSDVHLAEEAEGAPNGDHEQKLAEGRFEDSGQNHDGFQREWNYRRGRGDEESPAALRSNQTRAQWRSVADGWLRWNNREPRRVAQKSAVLPATEPRNAMPPVNQA